MISPQQYTKLMKKNKETRKIGESADKSGMDRKTARKYLKQGARGPRERSEPERSWLTRRNPFSEVWSEVEDLLGREPELQAKTIFEELQRRHPGKFTPGQKRTLERHVKRWKDKHGPEPTLIFAQEHRPGERMQLDWTHCAELGVTIAGEPYGHLLVHVVFPYSNWEWVRVCGSESYYSLRLGMQSALWEIGGVPLQHQTDQSSTATHAIGKGKREFNARYLGLCAHYEMEAKVIGVGKPQQNGDTESLNGHLKSAIAQELKLRGSSEFETVESYEAFLFGLMRKRNEGREKRVAEEKAILRPLPALRLAEFDEIRTSVNREGIVRVGHQGYSVPARWAGKAVRIKIEESKISIYDDSGQTLILSTNRRSGDKGVYVDWKHVILQLLRRPGAFARWRHRESMYPNILWRKLYDRLCKRFSNGRSEREYLRILSLALEHPITEVEAILEDLGDMASLDTVRQRLGIAVGAVVDVDFGADVKKSLAEYDGLIEMESVDQEEVG